MKISNIIAKTFYPFWNDLLQEKHSQYWLKGGRNSTKSSAICIGIISKMMIDAQEGKQTHAVCLRKVDNTVERSIFNTMQWAINKMGVSQYWEVKKNPREITYTPTQQKIVFTGCDDPTKAKGINFINGYCKYIWFEEVDQFDGMEDIRSITQTLMRGGSGQKVFFSYNPPKTRQNWVNAEALNTREDRFTHHSTYLDVPREWLSDEFIVDAEELKRTNPMAYDNEYLGIVTGTGGAIFPNVKEVRITDEDISHYDNVIAGVDFGYAVDPSVWLEMYYDKTRKRLYIFNEIYQTQLSNAELSALIIKNKVSNCFITCDSAEPKSIDELKKIGLRAKPAKKGPDSIDYGIKYLQNLSEIYIDPVRCPNAFREFSLYEYDKDKYGNFISRYPDANNHAIDATRYAIEDYTKQNKMQASSARLM